MSATYVYAVVGSGADGPLPSAADLRLVTHGAVAAVVGPAPEGDRAAGIDSVKAHADVVNRVSADRTTLPVQVGLVLDDDRQVVERVLEPHADRLTDLLEELAGRVELRVRARYDHEALLRAVLRSNRDISRLNEDVKRLRPGSGQAQRIELGERIAAGIERQQATDADHFLAALAPLAVRHRVHQAPPELVALNAAFLVEEASVADFEAAVQSVTQELGDRVATTVTGPVPPWDFVELDRGAP